MVMDSEAQMLYVFGGRVVDGDWDVSKFSELYSYNLITSKWKLLQYVVLCLSWISQAFKPSRQPLADPLHGYQAIPPRFGAFHS